MYEIQKIVSNARQQVCMIPWTAVFELFMHSLVGGFLLKETVSSLKKTLIAA